MRSKTVLLLTTAVLAAGALAPRTASSAPERPAPGPDVWIDAAGPVTDSDAAGFTIDRLRAVWPTPSTELPWDPASFGMEFPSMPPSARMPVAVGDFVHVAGSLQADGTVLVGFTYRSDVDEVGARDAGGPQPFFATGVVEAVGPASMTVGGRTYDVGVDQFLPTFSTIVYLQGQGCIAGSLADVRVGDAVLLDEESLADRGIAGRAVTHLLVRASGDGSTITGRVTRDGVSGEDAVLLAAPGRDFAVENLASFAPVPLHDDPEQHRTFDLVSGELGAGDAVTLHGRFRDGAFFVDAIDVLARAPAKAARARVRPRVHAEGVVTNADPRAFALNGVAVDLPRALRRALRRHPVRLGEPVVVDGRPSRRGHVVATRLRRS